MRPDSFRFRGVSSEAILARNSSIVLSRSSLFGCFVFSESFAQIAGNFPVMTCTRCIVVNGINIVAVISFQCSSVQTANAIFIEYIVFFITSFAANFALILLKYLPNKKKTYLKQRNARNYE
jgi:hypothetical protein